MLKGEAESFVSLGYWIFWSLLPFACVTYCHLSNTFFSKPISHFIFYTLGVRLHAPPFRNNIERNLNCTSHFWRLKFMAQGLSLESQQAPPRKEDWYLSYVVASRGNDSCGISVCSGFSVSRGHVHTVTWRISDLSIRAFSLSYRCGQVICGPF